jgi:hypothetical protein
VRVRNPYRLAGRLCGAGRQYRAGRTDTVRRIIGTEHAMEKTGKVSRVRAGRRAFIGFT